MKLAFSIFSYLSVYLVIVVECYEVPQALVEPLSPQGLRVSIPDEEGITLFAFHGNVNEDFENGKEAGQMATDVARKKDGRWTYVNRNIKLKKGDILYYWLYVVYKGLGYERLFQSHTVTDFYPSDKTSSVTPVIPTPTRPTLGPTQPPEQCKHTLTTVNEVPQTCSGALIFNSEFNDNLGPHWRHIVQFDDDEEFTVFDNDPETTFTSGGSLVIKPILLDRKHHQGFTAFNSLDLGFRCTALSQENCKKEPHGRIILPPVLSARITTEHSFLFKYGTVEIKAKLPLGDWVVPEIWLLPGRASNAGRANYGKITLANSLGNTDLQMDGHAIGNNYIHSKLQAFSRNFTYDYTKTSGKFSDAYHLFKMIWSPDRIRFYFNDYEIGGWSSSSDLAFNDEAPEKIAPFNQEFYLVLGVHVGGIHDFPDGCLNHGQSKPWRNDEVSRRKSFYDASQNWLKTWDDNTALRIEYVKVWSL